MHADTHTHTCAGISLLELVEHVQSACSGW